MRLKVRPFRFDFAVGPAPTGARPRGNQAIHYRVPAPGIPSQRPRPAARGWAGFPRFSRFP